VRGSEIVNDGGWGVRRHGGGWCNWGGVWGSFHREKMQ